MEETNLDELIDGVVHDRTGTNFSISKSINTNLPTTLTLTHYTQAGTNKSENQDALLSYIPPSDKPSLFSSYGAVFTVADGISSSVFGKEASQIAVNSFISDYLATPETWSVKTAGVRVLYALNSWLVNQSRQGGHSFNKDKGYVCALTVMIVQSRTVHIFSTGDVRAVMVQDNEVTQLTQEHRQIYDDNKVYLSAGLGLDDHLRLDYISYEAIEGATYCLLTDGVYEFITDDSLVDTVNTSSINTSSADTNFEYNLQINRAQKLCQLAVDAGSNDDVSALIVDIHALPEALLSELYTQNRYLPAVESLRKDDVIDGLRVIRTLSITPRSHTYLVTTNNYDEINSNKNGDSSIYVLKTPSVEKQNDQAHIDALLMEEWIARRLDNDHLMRAPQVSLPRTKCYTLSHYVEGQSLDQWMHEHPQPSLNQVRAIIEQIAKGLQALHRSEIIHRDLRPKNVLIDEQGTVTIIDFGEALLIGLTNDTNMANSAFDIPGSLQYSAPEYMLGSLGSEQSDIFSLGVLTYQMLSGHLPYGMKITSAYTKKAQQQLTMRPLSEYAVDVPQWISYAINKALAIDPKRRYNEVSEFIYELNHPSQNFRPQASLSFIERDPLRFWQALCGVLMLIVIGLITYQYL